MATYPWAEWLAESEGYFQWGVHFACRPTVFRNSLRDNLAKRDIPAEVKINGQYVSFRRIQQS